MKRAFFALVLVVSVFTLPFVLHGQAEQSGTAKRTPLAMLKCVRIDHDYFDLEKAYGKEAMVEFFKAPADIFNEVASELDARSEAYDAGTETRASLLESMERFAAASTEVAKYISAEVRVEILTRFSKQAEQLRKNIHVQDKKLAPSNVAELHRIRSVCLRANLELFKAEKQLAANKPPTPAPAAKLVPVP